MRQGENLLSHFPDFGTESALARWHDDREKLCVGQSVRGVVIARAQFGVWLDVGVGHPALLLVPEMAEARERSIKFEEYPQLGVIVEASILWLGEREDKRVTFNLTQHPRAMTD